MFKKIKEFFTGKPATQLEVEVKAEVPYKVEPSVPAVEPLPAGTEAAVITATAANVEAVVVVPEAVVPAEVVKAAPAKKAPKAKAPAKPKAEKAPKAAAPKAPKKPRAPKAQ
jgi:hypothetical protein